MMEDDPVVRTAAESWEYVLSKLEYELPDHTVAKSFFMAGMSVALSIAHHYGFFDLRAELDDWQDDGAAE